MKSTDSTERLESWLRSKKVSLRPDREDLTIETVHEAEVNFVPEELTGGLEMLGVLGTGGMGIVYEANQSSISRQVAVKMIREDCADANAVGRLVREAQVLGLLEHPNIVPIYNLTLEKGRPALVLKKIHGKKWSELMGKPEVIAELFGVDDPLTWNIKILFEVFDAVRFAHSRGIVHRDLKPSNVMIGEFGEVYVMDWGIAVSLLAIHEGRLPLASAITEVSGTPPYMAPEMLTPATTPLSVQTDVYLLGAILYEILMDRPPHQGSTGKKIYAKIAASNPEFDADLPSELVAICRQAMAVDPAERFASVEDFRRALQAYQSHRGARELAARAKVLLSHLRRELNGERNRNEVYNLFGPCRFAFQEALLAWEENQEARDGLLTCTELVVDYELSRGEPAAASALLAEIGLTEGARFEAVQTGLEARERADSESARLRQDADRYLDLRSRRATIACLGIGWTVEPILLKLFEEQTSYLQQTVAHVGFLLLWMGIGVIGKNWVNSTAMNRRLFQIVLTGGFLAIAVNLGSWLMGIPAAQAQVYHLFVFFTVGMTFVTVVDWRAWPTTIAYLIAFWVSAQSPEYSLWSMAVSNAMLVFNVFAIWRERSHKSEESKEAL